MAITVITRTDADTFTVAGDQTSIFHAGRRIKMEGGEDGYGTVLSSTFDDPNTSVNLTSGSDDVHVDITGVLYGIVSASESISSIPEHTHGGDEGSGGGFTAGLDIGKVVSYSNSTFNVGKDVENLGNTYDVMQYGLHTLNSTLSPGTSTVCIGLWQDADLKGGSPNHIVGLLGQARSSDSSTAGTLIGTEGKTYANVDGSTATGLLAFSYLNAASNPNSVVYGLQASTMALQGSGTGLSIAGMFSATGGSTNFDIMLAGAKNIVAWNSSFTGINYINLTDDGIELVPTSGGDIELKSNVDITGNIVVSGTVDGIDVGVDVAANTASRHSKDDLTLGSILSATGYNGTTIDVTVDDTSAVLGSPLFQASDFNFDRAQANATGTMPCMALAVDSENGANTTVLLEGQIYNAAWNWSAGPIYVSDTALGGLTQTIPDTTGDFVQKVGFALSADTMYFKPSSTVIEIA